MSNDKPTPRSADLKDVPTDVLKDRIRKAAGFFEFLWGTESAKVYLDETDWPRIQTFAENLGKHPAELVKGAMLFAGYISEAAKDLGGSRPTDLFWRSQDELLIEVLALSEQEARDACLFALDKGGSLVETVAKLLKEAVTQHSSTLTGRCDAMQTDRD